MVRRDPAFVAENAVLLQKRIDQLAHMATPSPLLFGDQLSIADCGFVASFALISIFREILGINVVLPPTLIKYEATLTAHESVTKQNTAYYKALNNWAKDKLKG
ncbi:glutathione S-transferase family protein [Candidatus Puniceispirillum marinum]|uniref:Glutathione S-transferase n=1 Tax=Puniceispirillum marinum (strain IMCC1322) TaxID=488538 RepID=D5BQ75_PUNMI|nr:glutathione S-transferase [Candidatus Puniceispirillum marinum]ADE38573.1 Glutathione S-transferase [Candidatus Puniceispirillum marinum IMCC1322]